MSASGVVELIHIAAAEGEPMQALAQARAIAGVGLEGDRYATEVGHYSGSREVGRHLTLIEAEVIEGLAADHGILLGPGQTRRNLTTRGIRLNDLVGVHFRVGEVQCRGTEPCEPCQYMADLVGKPVLRPLVGRGGLRAQILEGGTIHVGDSVAPTG